MSDMSEYSGAAAANSAAAVSSAILNSTGNLAASNFNYKNTKRLAKFQNEMNIQNWERQNAYNEKLAANYHSQILQSARNAGLNPAAALGGPNFAQQVGAIPSPSLTNSGSTAVSPDFSFLSQLPFMKSQVATNNASIDKMKAEAKVADAVADKTRAETTGIGLQNDLVSDTLQSTKDVTNKENKLRSDVIDMINNDESLKQAYAEEKRAFVENLNSQTDLNVSAESLNNAKVDTEKTTQLLNGAKVSTEVAQQYVLYTQGALNETQKVVLLDDNFRKNYSNVPYLLKVTERIIESDLSAEEKASMMVIVNGAMDEASKVKGEQRKFNYDKGLAATNSYFRSLVLEGMQMRNYSNASKLQQQRFYYDVLTNIISTYANIPADVLKIWFKGKVDMSNYVEKEGVQIKRQGKDYFDTDFDRFIEETEKYRDIFNVPFN